MRVFIVHRDVDYEFGEVWGVFLTRAGAEVFVDNVDARTKKIDSISIEEWETEGNQKITNPEVT